MLIENFATVHWSYTECELDWFLFFKHPTTSQMFSLEGNRTCLLLCQCHSLLCVKFKPYNVDSMYPKILKWISFNLLQWILIWKVQTFGDKTSNLNRNKERVLGYGSIMFKCKFRIHLTSDCSSRHSSLLRWFVALFRTCHWDLLCIVLTH